MKTTQRSLMTRQGRIPFPAYIPVTTFGEKYPLDNLIRPYLPRLAPAVMVSHYYARQMKESERPRIPLLVDSGGFVSLFQQAKVQRSGELGVIEVQRGEETELIHPLSVLEFQERMADVAFTLDFPIPPGMDHREAVLRQELTIINAHWALANQRRRDLPLYACVQAWDAASARTCARAYAGAGFEGMAIGGLVPRAQDLALITGIVEAVRNEIGDLPLHVFGLGKPELTKHLFDLGVDSVDSSSYVKLAADGRLWGVPQQQLIDPSPIDRLHLALCNLAYATGVTLPMSVHPVIFKTIATSKSLSFQV